MKNTYSDIVVDVSTANPPKPKNPIKPLKPTHNDRPYIASIITTIMHIIKPLNLIKKS